MIACENSGHSIADDFPEVRKIVEAGATSRKATDDELLNMIDLAYDTVVHSFSKKVQNEIIKFDPLGS